MTTTEIDDEDDLIRWGSDGGQNVDRERPSMRNHSSPPKFEIASTPHKTLLRPRSKQGSAKPPRYRRLKGVCARRRLHRLRHPLAR